jgi:hypothetical protein
MTEHDWKIRLLSLEPAFLTLGYIAAFFLGVGILYLGNSSAATTLLAVLGPSALLVVWMWSLKQVADAQLSPRHPNLRLDLWLLFVVLVLLLSLVALPSALSGLILGPAMLMTVFGYVLLVWRSAQALVSFEEAPKAARLHASLGTAILVFYLPIGIWFLYPRVRVLLRAVM